MSPESGSPPDVGPPSEGEAAVLQVRHLRKVFGGAIALADGNLSVRAGEIHGLLGENGAGKSTLIRCLARIYLPDAGEVVIDGLSVVEHPAKNAELAFIHQETGLVEELSVAENIAFAIGYPRRRLGFIDWDRVESGAREALAAMQIDLDPRRLVAELPPATRTAVAIARAVRERARIFVLDEPTANLSATEVQALFPILRRLRNTGAAVVFVSHRLDEVYELCDRVTVLRDGTTVGTVTVPETSQGQLVRLITGHEVVMPDHVTAPATAPAVIVADEVKGEFVGPVSFTVREGEIVGFTGLTDAGHYQLGALLFGLSPVESGSMQLGGSRYRPRTPREAMRRGIAYVPPDRGTDGVAREMSLAENLFLNPAPEHDIYGPRRFLSPRKERGTATELLTRFRVRPPAPDVYVSALSGGNAQKVLVARWLQQVPPLAILSDLTSGVDIGAREEIYEIVGWAARQGAAVMVMTSDFEEIALLCHRAYVLGRGRVLTELAGNGLDVHSITAHALSGGGQPR